MNVFCRDHSLLFVGAYVNTISVSNGIKYYATLKTMQLTCTVWVTGTGSQARDGAYPQRKLPWTAASSEQEHVLQ